MKILIQYASSELNVKNSRFLAEIFPINSASEARELLKIQKEKYEDARHVVHAFVTGENGEVLGCSDDGEPSGTAGRPALAVLKGSGITNIMLTVTRRFGGTLLGTGGLVKAYSDSAKLVLNEAQTEELIKKETFLFECSYSEWENLKRHLDEFSVEHLELAYEEKIRFKGQIPAEKKTPFEAFIENASKGGISLVFPADINADCCY
ncbi:YigZ family protein [Treponema sp. OMZ 792]|uniref:YigZ family protein n=1 Tax=unclassified Treponema TaxID=2638727 RepID=UPI0020A5264F|nr:MULTISPECIES: YigZ family protein [unclassified Treponema]UTC73996.1 YigZ family protein [Treponema sp. OMZ 792]UTC80396.1 YigZ family protein [Treponema sp. OMZ 798]